MKVPIPDRMKHLPIDRRGYPIPHGVVIDSDGKPHFAINDELRRRECLAEHRCSICGTKLFRGRWFVGGVLSAFHEHGAFIDPPMHSECAHFAVQVCPYLAAPKYLGEVGLAKAKQSNWDFDRALLIDTTMIPGRPTDDVFAVIMAVDQTIFENYNVKPKTPYRAVEFWRHGKRIPDNAGYATIQKALATPLNI